MAALALIVVSIVAVFASRYVARTQALQDAEHMTQRLASIVVAPILAERWPATPRPGEDLDRAIDNRMADGYLTEVTIWDADGRVVYANDPVEIGQQLEPPPEVIDAINEGVIEFRLRRPAGGHRADNSTGRSGLRRGLRAARMRQVSPGWHSRRTTTTPRVDEAANSLLLQLVPLVLVPLLVLKLIQLPIAASLARRVRRHEAERSALLERTSVGVRKGTGPGRGRPARRPDPGSGRRRPMPWTPCRRRCRTVHRPLMRDVQNTVTHAINSLRKLMVDLYPPDLSAEQLPGTISSLADPLRERGVESSSAWNRWCAWATRR